MSKAVSVKLEDEERARLVSLAEIKQRTPHYLMREAIREYLAREEQRAGFIKEAQDAWRDFERTGKHLTLADMEAWVRKLEKTPSQPLPKWRA